MSQYNGGIILTFGLLFTVNTYGLVSIHNLQLINIVDFEYFYIKSYILSINLSFPTISTISL